MAEMGFVSGVQLDDEIPSLLFSLSLLLLLLPFFFFFSLCSADQEICHWSISGRDEVVVMMRGIATMGGGHDKA